MEPLTMGGGLVERLIFEAYKNKDVRSAAYFKKTVKKDYGYNISSQIYAKIINYQIKRYGGTLQILDYREYVKNFGLKSNRRRKDQTELTAIRYRERSYLERVENEKNKC